MFKKIGFRILILIIFGMMVFGCDDDSESGSGNDITILNGTWTKSGYQLVINGASWSMKYNGTDESKGTGMINESEKLFTAITTHVWSSSQWQEIPSAQKIHYTATAQYSISGNTLILSNNNNETNMPMNGTWTK